MLTTWFLIGSIPFWILTVIALGLVTAAIENEKGLAATFCVGVYLSVIHFFGDANLLGTLSQHMPLLVAAIPVYFLLGAMWGIAKWFFFTRKIAMEVEEHYLARKTDFFKEQGLKLTETSAIPDSHREQWQKYSERVAITVAIGDTVGTATMAQVQQLIPQARAHKARITTWMTFWPTSFVWTMINDPVRAICAHIYVTIQQWLQNISNRAFSRVNSLHKADFEQPTQE